MALSEDFNSQSKYEYFVREMLKNGVRLSQNGRWHMSSAHSESDVEKTINAAYESFKALSWYLLKIDPA